MKEIKQTNRTKLKRLPKRGNFDRDVVNSILDEALVCHVGFVVDGKPFVIPTSFGRIGDTLVIHGSAASRMMRNLSDGIDVCVTVTLLDGLVLARSAFHHSVNYRSVVIFGQAEKIEDEAEKEAALKALTEHLIPGRWPETRPPNALELKATTVLTIPIEEASAKIRTGDPVDDEDDYELPFWAGIVPLRMVAGEPKDDGKLKDGVEVPEYVVKYER